jgi:hypothetical protein
MNTNLLNALKEIVSHHGGVETLSDTRRVKALLADLAAVEPRPQKNALTACLEQGFAALPRPGLCNRWISLAFSRRIGEGVCL